MKEGCECRRGHSGPSFFVGSVKWKWKWKVGLASSLSMRKGIILEAM